MPKYVVRHGAMRNLGVFSTRGGDCYARGDQVVARTNRGMEAGEVLCEASEHALANLVDPKYGQILRALSSEDGRDLRRLFDQQKREHESCAQRIKELQLPMRLVDVEHLYGGERIVVYYLADGRVDFRELVKLLAKEFQTRIEMRQIGVRDEAKLLADYGDCGKPVCCNTHLSEMPPVSMKMAKLQKATLDPSKISGRCGRLKCCLRYEYDTYQQLQKDLPDVGAEIITTTGRARVLAQEILSGQILIETEEMRRVVIDAADVLTVLSTGRSKRKTKKSTSDDQAIDSSGDGNGELGELDHDEWNRDDAPSHDGNGSTAPGETRPSSTSVEAAEGDSAATETFTAEHSTTESFWTAAPQSPDSDPTDSDPPDSDPPDSDPPDSDPTDSTSPEDDAPPSDAPAQ
jgi:cell fate regulator YaaT (PSP1 superfamily)